MVWTTWRQHRGEAIAGLTLAAVLAIAVIVTGGQMRAAFDGQGVAGCLVLAQPPSCAGVVQGYEQQFQLYISMYQWLNVLPLLLGIFVGAPLVAREIERGTHLLAWTQGVTRTRWIASKLILLISAAVLAGAAYTVLMTWWRQPLDAIDGSGLRPSAFDLEGIVPVGYFVAALAIGIAAGALIRRAIPAMGVAIIAFLVVRFGTLGVFRPNFMAPAVLSLSPDGQPPGSLRGGWVLSDQLVAPAGQVNGRTGIEQLCPIAADLKNSLGSCLSQHGVVETITYQPAARFWAFQLIEFGLFLGVSAALLCLTVWWVRRRIS
jgi:hypothetical protein